MGESKFVEGDSPQNTEKMRPLWWNICDNMRRQWVPPAMALWK